MTLNEKEQEFWNSYCKSIGLVTDASFDSVEASMAGNEDLADELLHLYLSGKKTAGSSLHAAYAAENEPLPTPEKHWMVLDSAGIPKCILKTIKVEINTFNDVPERIAIAEGEGDLSLEHWRKEHQNFFEPYLEDCGVQSLNDALIVTEHFELVYK